MASPLVPTISTTPTNDAKSSGVGELVSLDSSDYDFSSTKYPIDGLGLDDAPHYVSFAINVPENSKYITSGNATVDVQTASQQNFDLLSSIGGKTQITNGAAANAAGGQAIVSGLQGNVGGAVAGAVVGGGAAVAAEGIVLKPKFKRIKKAIAIYMPDTVITRYAHNYQTVSLTEALGRVGQFGSIGFEGLKSAVEGVKDNLVSGGQKIAYNSAQGAEVAGTLAGATGLVGSGFTELALKAANAAINPQAELIFLGTENRTYTFVFDFQPRSSAEARVIQDIIKTFRTYAAPEVTAGSNGRYFIPPAQFDIQFFFKNIENLNIAKISSCVLRDIQVNYSQAGQWATFNDGMPVHIQIVLDFKEVDIITRELIEKFGY